MCGDALLPLNMTHIPGSGSTASVPLAEGLRPAARPPFGAPTLRQTSQGLPALDQLDASATYSANHPRVQIYHPSQAPSAQSTENALMARALLSQSFAHSGAATKIARISNMFLDAPRFGSAVNLLS